MKSSSTERIVFVGDPHATVDELPDCGRLVDRIVDVVKEEEPDKVVFLGDQHHTHAVVRVEVIDFWRRSYLRIREVLGTSSQIRCVVGNHDMPGDSSSQAHAMQAYEDLVEVVDRPVVDRGILYLPYHHDPQEFVKACNLYNNVPTVVCHQAFCGGSYENGYPIQDGVNMESVPQQHIISGHIHSPQQFGRVWYPGAPRWRTRSDANVERAIWAVDFEEGRPLAAGRAYDTAGYCRKLVEVDDHEGGLQLDPQADLKLQEPVQVTVGIYGSREYVAARQEHWKRLGCRVRSFVTEAAAPRVRESDGIAAALQKFVAGYKPKFGTSPEVLQRMVGQRVQV